MTYVAPLAHLKLLIDLFGETAEPIDGELIDGVLAGAGRFAEEVLAPLNASGDREGARWTPQGVRSPAGFREAYRRFSADGWTSLSAPPGHGGANLPQVAATAVGELWASANLSFALCAEANVGAIQALVHHATPELRARFLPHLVSGTWSSTMCLSEPSAGSDLSTVATRAVPDGDIFRLYGRKIYVTWGEHDLCENILHLVLARLPDSPAGAAGLSLFAVPRFLADSAGQHALVNDIHAVSIERKMGLHASPTCVMALGDRDGAVGYLLGTPHRGLACMFTMMNVMRLGVALQGGAVAERAFQLALSHARQRVQGRDALGRPTAIVNHADVRRMLLTMRALARVARTLTLATASALDRRQRADSPAAAARCQARADLLTPIAKAWCSEAGIEAAALGVQVHGGMGYVEDCGAAQLYRDVRVTSIFEGTNYIQAHDLLARKVLRDKGDALTELFAELASLAHDERQTGSVRTALLEARELVATTTAWIAQREVTDPMLVGATATNYLMLVGYALGAHWCALSASAAPAARARGSIDESLARELADDAQFFAAYLLPRARLHADLVRAGSAILMRASLAEA